MLIITFVAFILVAPTIHPEVTDQAQNEGDNASFTCQATGEPVPTTSWYFNGILVVNGMEHMISMMLLNTTTINFTLAIMNVQSSDVGTYTCNATNVVSTDTSSGVLTVIGELSISVFDLQTYHIHNSCLKRHYTNGRRGVYYH